MTCPEALSVVEAIAGEELAMTSDLRVHFETCPLCAAALASARRLESALAARVPPPAPTGFTAAVVARVRKDRWRSEQQVDRLFNVAIALAIVLVLGSIAALVNLRAFVAAIGGAWKLGTVMATELAARAAPAVVTYVAAAGLLISALLTWWWAERRLSL